MTDMETIGKDLLTIIEKFAKARGIWDRNRERLDGLLGELSENSANQRNIRSLKITVKGLLRFLDICERGRKEGISVLRAHRRVVRRAKLQKDEKGELRNSINFQIDVLKETKIVIKTRREGILELMEIVAKESPVPDSVKSMSLAIIKKEKEANALSTRIRQEIMERSEEFKNLKIRAIGGLWEQWQVLI